jgi:peptidoglycan/LPS O-acetylase OafA/YrhL
MLGNTYYRVLSGPLKNLEVVSQWVTNFFFLFVLQADFICDIFFWITGFVMSYQLLKKKHENNGNWWTSPIRIFFERYFRFIPLYMFMIFFLSSFISIFGGLGPRFYQF